ncbi:putative catabolite repression protein creC [Ditylenchus destructor]|nr:putative catabolite repression protein creC [Ditylenchus destructor]
MQASTFYGKCAAGVISPYSIEQSATIAQAVAPDEAIKTSFCAPEGIYKQMTISEYSRPTRVPLNQTASPISNSPVRVSFLSVPLKATPTCDGKEEVEPNGPKANGNAPHCIERICFNVGREIYVYDYGGIHSASDLSKPVDKRIYKGTFPTCHDFNEGTATIQSCMLIIGFSAGQIQLVDPYQKEFQSRLYNEDRVIDKTAVTCLKWVPGQSSMFIASHASGNLYVYNDEYVCAPNPPVFQLFKQGEGYAVYNCKTKSPRNPVQKWSIGEGSINQFDFSNKEGKFLATAGQDGFLRIFNYESMELVGFIKSYFGGLLCLAWSPDLQLIATGGEDDMLTIYSVQEKRVLCRGQGHKSWISQVAFDPYICATGQCHNDRATLKSDSTHSTKDESPMDTSVPSPRGTSPINSNGWAGGQRNTNQLKADNTYSRNISTKESPIKDIPCSHSNCTASSSNAAPAFNNYLIRPHKDSFSSTPMAWLAAGEKATSSGSGTDCINNACSSSSSIFGQGYSTETKPRYRIGTVSHDTQLCLWDLPDDILQQCGRNSDDHLLGNHINEAMSSATLNNGLSAGYTSTMNRNKRVTANNATIISIGCNNSLGRGESVRNENRENTATTSSAQATSKPEGETAQTTKETKSRLKKLHKRGLSFGSKLTGHDRWTRNNDASGSLNGLSPTGNHNGTMLGLRRDEANRIFGTPQCPRMDDVPMIEPLVCKKIAHERLTVVHFREDCLVTACQEGFVCTWARPGKITNQRNGGVLSVSHTLNNMQSDGANSDLDSTCV